MSSMDIKLYKWNLRLQLDTVSQWEEMDISRLIAAQFLVMIESQGISRFVVHDDEDGNVTKAWLVGIRIRVAATWPEADAFRSGCSPRRCFSRQP